MLDKQAFPIYPMNLRNRFELSDLRYSYPNAGACMNAGVLKLENGWGRLAQQLRQYASSNECCGTFHVDQRLFASQAAQPSPRVTKLNVTGSADLEPEVHAAPRAARWELT